MSTTRTRCSLGTRNHLATEVLRATAGRSSLVVLLLFLGFVALAARAFWIQGPGNAFYELEGKKRFQRTLEMPATRGKIFDRTGQVLATSLPVKAIWAIPEEASVALSTKTLGQVSGLLNMAEPELKHKLGEDKNFVYLKRQVSTEVAEKIAALKIEGIYQQREYKRFYPEGAAMAHIIGFTNVEDRGQEGMELSQEKELAGQAGRRKVIKDRMGRAVEELGVIASPREGKDLQLSIDSKIQYLAFDALRAAVEKHRAKAGSVVVVDAQTGEILALANLPTYNPNDRTHLSGEQLRNRVLTDTFEPGSSAKPITVALALELGRVKPHTIIQTGNGKFTIAGSTITDTHAYGALTVEQVIQKSSNIGMIKIAKQLSSKEMWGMFTHVGFGQAPKIGFPGAVAGKVRPYQSWRPIEQATMSYGYGLSTSLLQLARAYTIFASDGELIPLSMTKVDAPVQGVRVISPHTAQVMRGMLELAAGTGGTGLRAQAEGYRVGGKSGTAHKQVGKGYAAHRYNSFFVGLAPIHAPRIVVAVMLEEPSDGTYFGGAVAAPVFSTVVSNTLRALNVLPDNAMSRLAMVPALPKSRAQKNPKNESENSPNVRRDGAANTIRRRALVPSTTLSSSDLGGAAS
ncbi:MAG: penicillin-binding protein 2 [Ottowia sp.]|nr:penicillin-binding protein 2 [Ottowia sp.]